MLIFLLKKSGFNLNEAFGDSFNNSYAVIAVLRAIISARK